MNERNPAKIAPAFQVKLVCACDAALFFLLAIQRCTKVAEIVVRLAVRCRSPSVRKPREIIGFSLIVYDQLLCDDMLLFVFAHCRCQIGIVDNLSRTEIIDGANDYNFVNSVRCI